MKKSVIAIILIGIMALVDVTPVNAQGPWPFSKVLEMVKASPGFYSVDFWMSTKGECRARIILKPGYTLKGITGQDFDVTGYISSTGINWKSLGGKFIRYDFPRVPMEFCNPPPPPSGGSPATNPLGSLLLVLLLLLGGGLLILLLLGGITAKLRFA